MVAVAVGGVQVALWVLVEAAFASMDTDDDGVVDDKGGTHRKAAAEVWLWEAAGNDVFYRYPETVLAMRRNSDDNDKLTLKEVQDIEVKLSFELLDADSDGGLDWGANSGGQRGRPAHFAS
jgi:hypothetical protein